MNKRGFTLTELLVVIAIVGILSVIIIPNVVKVNDNINERIYTQREEFLISAAQMYAESHPNIFHGSDVTSITVMDLILAGYAEPDTNDDDICSLVHSEDADIAIDSKFQLASGCVSDPRYSTSMNSLSIRITKKNVGIVAEINYSDETSEEDVLTLVMRVCKGIDNGTFIGKYDTGSDKYCECKYSTDDSDVIDLVKRDGSGQPVDSCILVSPDANGNVNNWLKYGASSANWRVVGLYKIPKEGVSGEKEVVAKIITSNVVD